MADINIKFDTTGAGESSSQQYLINVLQRLNISIEKLASVSEKPRPTTGADKAFTTTPKPFDAITKDFTKAVDAYNAQLDNALKNFGNRLGSTLMTSTMAAVGVTAIRFANAESTAIVAKATSRGSFAGAAVEGRANETFGAYIGSFYSIEKNRQQEERTALYEGVATAVGTAVGSIIPGGGAIGGKLLGGAAGYAAGKLLAASPNSETEQQMLIRGALASRDAMASVQQWRTGFSRFGLTNKEQTLVPADLNGGQPITAPLASDFQKRYGQSQNYNGILNGIVPNLNANPLDRGKTGDLDKTAQNFIKAGFAAGDFAKLTAQSSQYTAVTGRNIEQFSEDVKIARAKFGEAFDTGTLQTSLNLMAIGYKKDQAQDIAYQAQFNPGMAGNINRFANMGFSEFERNKAIGRMVGININESLRTGQFVGTDEARTRLKHENENYMAGGEYGRTMMLLGAAGFTHAAIASLFQDKAAVNAGFSKQGLNSEMSPAQQMAQDIMTAIGEGLKNVQNMTVNAQSVIISGQIPNNNFNFNSLVNSGVRSAGMAPPAFGGSHNPAGK